MDPKDITPSTLFVAVADHDGLYAGEDGGPAKGGIGRWRVGQVGPWTSSAVLPLAYRDPATGLVHSGWLEVAEQTQAGPNGTLVCTKSQKRFSIPRKPGQRAAAVAREAGMAEPSLEAVARAEGGPTDMTEALKPLQQRKRGRPPKAAGRPMDAVIAE